LIEIEFPAAPEEEYFQQELSLEGVEQQHQDRHDTDRLLDSVGAFGMGSGGRENRFSWSPP